jgi:hypothetical protein
MLYAGTDRSASFSNSLSLSIVNGLRSFRFCAPTLHHSGDSGCEVVRYIDFSESYVSVRVTAHRWQAVM